MEKTAKTNLLFSKPVKSQQETPRRKRTNKKEVILIIFLVLLLIALVGVTYLYFQEKKKMENPTQVATEEAKKIKEKVGKLILLPENEEPTIATIIDVDKLREENPEFYKNATNGDKLLVYPQKAILYDPDRNIVINVAPVIRQPSDEEAKKEENVKKNESLTIELRNGSWKTGKTAEYEDKIKKELGENYKVVSKVNAAKKSYQGVTVYDLTSGKKSDLAKKLADTLSAKIESTLPVVEKKSNVEVVVIVGN
ncbi:hypothetical protein COY23_00675 [bacterium (Candidatus Torokbacteria) CG_4_10_14_0_2_um_filter_35_8]|nr:MAG: hypothetical protein COY23_00675 [bacterium (Candidatus Torokbacteria) CG_4_10_14_0_2_um_filter_35_8]